MAEPSDLQYARMGLREEARWPRLVRCVIAVAVGSVFAAALCAVRTTRQQRKLRTAAEPLGAVRTSRSGYFLQLSDVHLDPWYNASMGRACFCNAPAGAEERATCAASSTGSALGQHGCDAPVALLHSLLAAAVARAPPGGYDWVLVTGDYTRHGMGKQKSPHRQAVVRGIMREVKKAVEKYFPNVAVHHGLGVEPYILGNNDFTADYNETVTDPTRGTNPWFSFLAPSAAGSAAALTASDNKHPTPLAFTDADWSPLDDQATFVFGGYGMRRLTDQLYVISLNTVVYSTHFKWKRSTPEEDPFRQLHWLVRALEWLRKGNLAGGQEVKALITGHIPPTMDHFKFQALWRDRFVKAYLGIIANYTDVVSAQLFAHMHCDTFRLPPAGTAGTPVFITSSISPVFDNNPSFRVWKYSGPAVLDYTMYGGDIIRDGLSKELSFQPLYSAAEAYGLNAMTTEEWRKKVADQLPSDDVVWEKYMSRLWQRSSGSLVEASIKSPEYRQKAVCSINNMRKGDFEACVAAQA